LLGHQQERNPREFSPAVFVCNRKMFDIQLEIEGGGGSRPDPDTVKGEKFLAKRYNAIGNATACDLKAKHRKTQSNSR
jgi:hypothetical protein